MLGSMWGYEQAGFHNAHACSSNSRPDGREMKRLAHDNGSGGLSSY
jgi:hypothetical protein